MGGTRCVLQTGGCSHHGFHNETVGNRAEEGFQIPVAVLS